MATFNEIFQNYVDYGFTRPTTPVSTVQGIETLAPTLAQPTVSTVADSETQVSPSTVGSTGKVSKEGIMQAIGFMMNPALGITNMAVQNITGKSIAQQVMDAVNSMMGRNTTPTSQAYGYTGGSGDTGSAPGAGDPNASMGDTGMATGGDGGGVGSSSDAGAGSTDSCGSFKDGGYVALGINPKDFK
jgi:hypothetical protein